MVETLIRECEGTYCTANELGDTVAKRLQSGYIDERDHIRGSETKVEVPRPALPGSLSMLRAFETCIVIW